MTIDNQGTVLDRGRGETEVGGNLSLPTACEKVTGPLLPAYTQIQNQATIAVTKQ